MTYCSILTILTFRATEIGRALTLLVTNAVTAVQASRVAHWFTVRYGWPLEFSWRPFSVLTKHVRHGRRVRELVSVDTADRTSAGNIRISNKLSKNVFVKRTGSYYSYRIMKPKKKAYKISLLFSFEFRRIFSALYSVIRLFQSFENK